MSSWPPPSSSSSATQYSVNSASVIQLILQFLRDHQLLAAARTLQAESGVALPALPNAAATIAAVRAGDWASVLQACDALALPLSALAPLYEHIALELAEQRENDAAMALLRDAPPLQQLAQAHPERYARLQQHIERRHFDAAAAYGGSSSNGGSGGSSGGGRDARRAELAALLQQQLVSVPPARLLTLLQQALRYQALCGVLPAPTAEQASAAAGANGNAVAPFIADSAGAAAYDLFRGSFAAPPSAPSTGTMDALGGSDATPIRCATTIRFTANSAACALCWLPDGAHLASGSSDGFIELWDAATGKLSTQRYAYQARDELMQHADAAVLALECSASGELLASGSSRGDVKVWQLDTGACLRKFTALHAAPASAAAASIAAATAAAAQQHGAIASLRFSRDATQLLSAATDGSVKLLGLRSGTVLRVFAPPGAAAFVHCAIFMQSGDSGGGSVTVAPPQTGDTDDVIVSSSSDGSLRVWNVRTGECVRTVRFTDAADSIDSNGAHANDADMLGATGSGNGSSSSNGSSSTDKVRGQRLVARGLGQLLRIDAHRLLVLELGRVIRMCAMDGRVLVEYRAPSPADDDGVAAAAAAATAVAAVGAASMVAGKKEQRPASAVTSGAESAVGDFIRMAVSPHHQFLFGLTLGGALHTFNLRKGDHLAVLQMHKSDALALAQHPHQSLIASASRDATIKLWKA